MVGESSNLWPKPSPEEKNSSSLSRSRSTIRRLIYANAGTWKDRNGYSIPPKFLTLTFHENIQDLKLANHRLMNFIQRLNYQFGGVLVESLKYICVPEFQQRGAIHYHLVLFNFPFVDRVFKRLRDCWGGDRIELKTIRNDAGISNIIGYVSKYITKQADDPRFFGQKRYFASRGIKKPIIIRDDVAIELIRQSIQGFEKIKTIFNIPFCGDVNYWTYCRSDGKSIESLNLDPYVKEQIEKAKKL